MRVGSAAAAVLIASSLVSAPPARAYDPGCVSSPFLYGLRMTTRTLCDGAIQPDGGWLRARRFYAAEYWSSGWCSRYSCTLGHWVPEFIRQETYYVTPDTVLPDEPPHIDEGVR